jgi:hypothetical protein
MVIHARSVVQGASSDTSCDRTRAQEYSGRGGAFHDRADSRRSCGHTKGDSSAYLDVFLVGDDEVPRVSSGLGDIGNRVPSPQAERIVFVDGVVVCVRVRGLGQADCRVNAQELPRRRVVVAVDYGVFLDAKVGGPTPNASLWRGVVGTTL